MSFVPFFDSSLSFSKQKQQQGETEEIKYDKNEQHGGVDVSTVVLQQEGQAGAFLGTCSPWVSFGCYGFLHLPELGRLSG